MKIKIKRKTNSFVFLADEIVIVSVVTSELSGESLTLYIMYIIHTAVCALPSPPSIALHTRAQSIIFHVVMGVFILFYYFFFQRYHRFELFFFLFFFYLYIYLFFIYSLSQIFGIFFCLFCFVFNVFCLFFSPLC